MPKGEFTKKKIGTLTLGEKLKKIRGNRRISLAEAAKSTKIQAKYLECLENEEFEKLPADVYVKGFLRSYASYLGINDKSLVKAYERERKVRKHIKKEEKKESFIKPVNFSKFTLTPKTVIAGVVIILVFLGFFYLYSEINSFVSTPRLVIYDPEDGFVTKETSVNVSGITEKDAEVMINGQGVLVSDEGEFNENVSLQNGINTITISSKNRFDKEEIRTVIVRAEFEEDNQERREEENDSSSEDEIKIEMEVRVDPNSTWLSISSDENLVFSGVMNSGDKKVFEAKEKISVTSGKGNNTYIKINNKEEIILSPDPGLVEDIMFNISDYQ